MMIPDVFPSSQRSSKTLRILSLDGGGMRGYLSAHWLNLFIQEWGIQGHELWKHFDIIAGTSIGGIQALAYASGLSPEDLFTFFEEDGPWIFTTRGPSDVTLLSCTASDPSSPPNTLNKLLMLAEKEPFYESVREIKEPILNTVLKSCTINDGNYGDFRLQKKLRQTFKNPADQSDLTLKQLKTKVLITSYEQKKNTPTFFSNLDVEGLTGQDFKVSDVALCTSAAPIYFPSIPLTDPVTQEDLDFIDGGVFQNNPASLAYSIGQIVAPLNTRCCVLSIGTGRGDIGFDHVSAQEWQALGYPGDTQGITGLVKILKIAMEAAQETIHQDMRWKSLQPFNNLSYYRFQVKLDPNKGTDLDQSDPSFLRYLEGLARDHFYNPQHREAIGRFINSLNL